MAADSSTVLPESQRSRSDDLSSLESNTTSWWRRSLIVLAGLLVIAWPTTRFLIETVASEEAGPRLLHTIQRGDLMVTVTADGTLQSSSNKDIKCKVKGGSTVLWVIEGGSIAKVGDVLVRLDRATIEDNISTKEIAYQTAKAAFAQSESDVAVAKINIEEYLQGLYQAEVKTKEMAVAVAKANLTVAKNTLEHSKKMFRKGFVSELELQSAKFSIERAQLDLDVKNTDLHVLNRYTKAKTLQDLRGILKAKTAKLASDSAGLALEKGRLQREKRQLTNCSIRAKVAGMVVFPEAARWKQAPAIEEGAAVREDQIVLVMPDLNKMQVNVGVPESKVDQLKVGMPCLIELQNGTLKGTVKTIATVAGRTGWWTGNIVKYDTVIKVAGDGLKPGMSAKVHIEVARNMDVLTIPVAAVMQSKEKY